MAAAMQGVQVAILVANEGVEESELTKPREALGDAGAEPVIVSLEPGSVQAFRHLDKGGTYPVDATVSKARCEDYVGLVLPGGVANPDRLRMDEDAVRFVREFFDAGKPVAAICHGPWMLAEADVARGRRLTSWPSLQTDLRNAGATWVDEEVVLCSDGPNVLVTSRNPGDLPAFCDTMLRVFQEALQRA